MLLLVAWECCCWFCIKRLCIYFGILYSCYKCTAYRTINVRHHGMLFKMCALCEKEIFRQVIRHCSQDNKLCDSSTNVLTHMRACELLLAWFAITARKSSFVNLKFNRWALWIRTPTSSIHATTALLNSYQSPTRENQRVSNQSATYSVVVKRLGFRFVCFLRCCSPCSVESLNKEIYWKWYVHTITAV